MNTKRLKPELVHVHELDTDGKADKYQTAGFFHDVDYSEEADDPEFGEGFQTGQEYILVAKTAMHQPILFRFWKAKGAFGDQVENIHETLGMYDRALLSLVNAERNLDIEDFDRGDYICSETRDLIDHVNRVMEQLRDHRERIDHLANGASLVEAVKTVFEGCAMVEAKHIVWKGE